MTEQDVHTILKMKFIQQVKITILHSNNDPKGEYPMLLLVAQSILASRVHDFAQKFMQRESAAVTSVPQKRSAADASNALTEYWRASANDSHVMTEMNLFPKRMML